jgi:hypothetical protein
MKTDKEISMGKITRLMAATNILFIVSDTMARERTDSADLFAKCRLLAARVLVLAERFTGGEDIATLYAEDCATFDAITVDKDKITPSASVEARLIFDGVVERRS